MCVWCVVNSYLDKSIDSVENSVMTIRNPSTNLASAAVVISSAIWGLYWIPLRYLKSLGVAEAWTVVMINIPAAVVIGVIFMFQFKAQQPHLRRGVMI